MRSLWYWVILSPPCEPLKEFQKCVSTHLLFLQTGIMLIVDGEREKNKLDHENSKIDSQFETVYRRKHRHIQKPDLKRKSTLQT